MGFPDSGQVLRFAQKWSVELMFYDRFRFLCGQKGVSCNKAATDMGLSNSTPTKWKKTGATPDSKTLSLVSHYFGVPISYLLAGEEEMPTLVSESGQQINMITLANRNGRFTKRQLSDEQIALFQSMLDQMKPIDDENI